MTEPNREGPREWNSRRVPSFYEPLRDFATDRVSALQRDYFGPRQPQARAALAALRNAVGRQPGADPGTWALTLDGLPPQYAGSNAAGASAAERAVHAGLCLYAIHQQSGSRRMHEVSRPFGTAIGRLMVTRDAEKALYRRFQACAGAADLTEAITHARSLVQQLRAAEIGFDYGRFVVDLTRLQSPAQADQVRLGWGRDLYAKPPAQAAATPATHPESGAAE